VKQEDGDCLNFPVILSVSGSVTVKVCIALSHKYSYAICMKQFYMLTIANVCDTAYQWGYKRQIEALRICTSENYAQKFITKLYNY